MHVLSIAVRSLSRTQCLRGIAHVLSIACRSFSVRLPGTCAAWHVHPWMQHF